MKITKGRKIWIVLLLVLVSGGIALYLGFFRPASVSTPRQVGIQHNYVKDQYAVEELGDTVLLKPSGIDVDDLNNVYVVDYEKSQIFVFNPDGEHIRTIGKLGNGEGELYRPMGITIHNDLIYVADAANYRIQIFSLEGEFKKIISFQKEDVRPKDLVLHNDAIYLTVDSLIPANIKVYKVDSKDRITSISDTLIGYIARKDDTIAVANQLNLIKSEKGHDGVTGIHNLYFLNRGKIAKSKIEFPYKYAPFDFLFDAESQMYYIICGIYHTIDRFSADGKYIDTIFKNEQPFGFLNYIAMDSEGVVYCTATENRKVYKIKKSN